MKAIFWTVSLIAGVLLGFADVMNQLVATKTLEEVHNELRKIEPPAFPDVETVALGTGNSVIALRVPGGGGPYVQEGGVGRDHGIKRFIGVHG